MSSILHPCIPMQNVHFDSIDEFLAYLSPGEREIVQRLRAVVKETMPESEERLSYNVPYYRRHTDVCFIWPGSVAWAGKTKPGVTLGFCRGNLMDDPRGFLDLGTRKQVAMRVFLDVNDIDDAVVREYLSEAVRVDEERAAAKKRV